MGVRVVSEAKSRKIPTRNILPLFPVLRYDSCYHNACDSLDNVNALALAEMVGAADHVFRQIAELDNPAA